MTGSRSGSTSTSLSRRAPAAPRPKKRFGQHFLSDTNILNRIADAAEIAPGEPVIEVGPGLGALTVVLAERTEHVVAVEVDRDLIAALRQRFAETPSVAIVESDVLERTPGDLLAAGGAAPPYAVVANLPYNIAAPTLRHFLESETPPRCLVVMVQLEVAESICSRPPHMTLLGAATQLYADARIVMRVAPGAFYPPPKVQSAVVRLDVLPQRRVDVPVDAFFRIVRAGFGNPRKQLRNSLSFGLHVKQEVIDTVMATARIDVTLRPQALSLDDWAAIARAWLARPQP